MPLMVCPDCGKKHSDAAPSCPECGRPVHLHDEPPTGLAISELAESRLSGITLGGRYRLGPMIGKGGMACVYRGVHLDLRTDVAIKIVYRNLASDPQIQSRFRKEARIQFTLQHPGIVRVLDLLEDQGFLGLAMDWIEGKSMVQWLKSFRRPPPTEEIVRIFTPILKAMGYAHGRQIIHRDIKPGNILLKGPDGQEQPVITDFGIAKILDDVNESQTASNLSLGTPTYMSPEQVEARKDIDHRADIYSMGIMLYRVATGRPPFRHGNPMATAMAHLREPVPALLSMNPQADARLEPILQRALAKEPEDRFCDCEDFLQALQQLLRSDTLRDSAGLRATTTDFDQEWMAALTQRKTEASAPETPPREITQIFGSPPPGSPSAHLGDTDVDPEGKGSVLVDRGQKLDHTLDAPPSRRSSAATSREGSELDPVPKASPSLREHGLSMATIIENDEPDGVTSELLRQSRGLSSRKGLWFALSGVVALIAVLAVGKVALRTASITSPGSTKAMKKPLRPIYEPDKAPRPRPRSKVGLIPAPRRPQGLRPATQRRPSVLPRLRRAPKRPRRTRKPRRLRKARRARKPRRLRKPRRSPPRAVAPRKVRPRPVNAVVLYWLILKSKPKAKVYVDGFYTGVTPLRLRALEGQIMQVQLKKANYVSHSFPWRATRSQTKTIYLAPEM